MRSLYTSDIQGKSLNMQAPHQGELFSRRATTKTS